MRTYNFIYWTRDGKCEQVEINAESEDNAWRQFHGLISDVTYVDLIK